jgi:phage baseplate assembly protein W
MATYSDLSLNLTRNPFTNDLMIKTDVAAVKQAILNLMYTRKYDKFFNPDMDSKIFGLLFENYDPILASYYEQKIVEIIETYEPRAVIESVTIEEYLDGNQININITFFVRNFLQIQTLDIKFDRIR